MWYGMMMVVVAFVCIAMMWPEGMWGNAITFMNVILAILVSMNFFEPVASFLAPKVPSFAYYWDFLSLWLIFVVSLAVFSIATDELSKSKVRFRMPVEQAGRAIFALLTAWVFICFVTTTMHTAPLARTAFKGSFEANGPLSNNVFGRAPDRMLLSFIQSASQGSLKDLKPRTFDEKGEFILKYGARRHMLKEYNAREGTTRVGN